MPAQTFPILRAISFSCCYEKKDIIEKNVTVCMKDKRNQKLCLGTFWQICLRDLSNAQRITHF